MADVCSFRGIRYADTIELDRVVAPPYDVLSAAQVAELRGRDAGNVIHVDLPVGPGDSSDDDAYARAAAVWQGWRETGVLVRDDEPSVYFVDQHYQGPDGRRRTRHGLVARLKLADFSAGVVLPHERTHASAKADRLALYRAMHADLSQIFLLYPDDDGSVGAAVAAARAQATVLGEARDGDGNVHTLASVSGAAADAVCAALADRRLYIADGHHRYETALAYRDERRAAGDGSADTLMVYLCAMDDPGLAVFPTHRLVRGATPSLAAVTKRLEPLFTVVERVAGRQAAATRVAEWLIAPEEEREFALYGPADSELVIVRLANEEAAAERLAAEGLHGASAELAVTMLHRFILGDGVGLAAKPKEGEIAYVSSVDDAFAGLDGGGYGLCVFTRSTRVDEVRAVADKGEVMPQKSTYFYPKLLTGLVFDALGE